MSVQEYDINAYDYTKWKNLRDQFLQDYNRLTQRRVLVAQIKCSSQLGNGMSDQNFYKTGKIVLNSNVETIALETTTTKRQKLTDKVTKKRMAVLDKSMKTLNSKPEQCTEVYEDVFGKIVAVTLKCIRKMF